MDDDAPGIFYVTAFEVRRVRRAYMGSCQNDAVEKMSRWIAHREDEGRDFTGTLHVERAPLVEK